MLGTNQLLPSLLLKLSMYYRSHPPSCRSGLGVSYLSLAAFISELQTCGFSEPLGTQIPSGLVAD